jgi:hypothetical protein
LNAGPNLAGRRGNAIAEKRPAYIWLLPSPNSYPKAIKKAFRNALLRKALC